MSYIFAVRVPAEVIEENYGDYPIVFSSKRGFHIHVFDFDYKDWCNCNFKDAVKCQEAARYRYAKLLKLNHNLFFNFVTSVDPMRVMRIPGSVNGWTGLIALPIGKRGDLERISISHLLARADACNTLFSWLPATTELVNRPV